MTICEKIPVAPSAGCADGPTDWTVAAIETDAAIWIWVICLRLLPGLTPSVTAENYQFFTAFTNSRKNLINQETAMTLMEASPARPPGPLAAPAVLSPRDALLMEKAKALEAAFLAEMLAHSGRDADAGSAFGGGAGEEQFASFLRQEEARLMVDRGGIGLAESLFHALKGASGNG